MNQTLPDRTTARRDPMRPALAPALPRHALHLVTSSIIAVALLVAEPLHAADGGTEDPAGLASPPGRPSEPDAGAPDGGARVPSRGDAADAGAAVDTLGLAGEVLDERGVPYPGVVVVAVEGGGAAIRASARSNAEGRFAMRLPRRVHDFAVLSPRYVLTAIERVGDAFVRLRIRAAFPDADLAEIVGESRTWVPTLVAPRGEAPAGGNAVVSSGRAVGLLSGTVTDETGVPLGGVRVLAAEGRGRAIAAATLTNAKGRYTLATTVGLNRIFVYAPGLKIGAARRPAPGALDLTLAIDARVEEVTVRLRGRRLRFRMDDSIWPEYMPPSEVRTALRADYGIDTMRFCPGNLLDHDSDFRPGTGGAIGRCWKEFCPASVQVRQCKLPRFWWLRLLQVAPPNPSRADALWWIPIIRDMQQAEAAAARVRAAKAGAPAAPPRPAP